MSDYEFRSYRHRLTGVIQQLSPRTASADPNLEEVAPDAKPLAYTPIPQSAIEALGIEDGDAPVFHETLAELATDDHDNEES